MPSRGLVDLPWYNQQQQQQQQQQQPISPPTGSSSSTSSSSSSLLVGGRSPWPSATQHRLQALLSASSPPNVPAPRPVTDVSAVAETEHLHHHPAGASAAFKPRSPGLRPLELIGHAPNHYPPSPPPDHPPSGVVNGAYGAHADGTTTVMEPPQTYMDLHQSQMSGGQPPTAPTATSSSMAHYASYGHPPPLLQPVPAAYPSAQNSFHHYPYANGVTSPPTAAHSSGIPATASHVPAQLLPLPGMMHHPN